MNNCIKDFWNYFEKNNFAFLMLNELEIEIKNEKCNELNRLLQLFHPKLGFILNTSNTQNRLIITAHGNPYLFKSVDLLVKYAPVLINWSVIACIPPSQNLDNYRNGTDQTFYYHGISLKISEMKYAVISCDNNPLLVSLNIYVKNFMVHSYNDYLVTAIYIILEMLLGEKSFSNEIHFVKISQITTEAEENLKLVALYHLPAYIAYTRKMSAEELA